MFARLLNSVFIVSQIIKTHGTYQEHFYIKREILKFEFFNQVLFVNRRYCYYTNLTINFSQVQNGSWKYNRNHTK